MAMWRVGRIFADKLITLISRSQKARAALVHCVSLEFIHKSFFDESAGKILHRPYRNPSAFRDNLGRRTREH